MKRFLFFLTCVFFGGLIGFLIGEISVRTFKLAPNLPENIFYTSDPFLPYKLKPLHHAVGTSLTREYQYDYTTNSYGFVDVEHDIEKSSGTFRILILGDSFTQGVGAYPKESYPIVLQTLLNSRAGNHPKIECINAGQSAYWTELEYIMAKEYGFKFNPDLVLVGFLPNDVIDTFQGVEAARLKGGKYLVSKEAYDLGDFGLFIYLHSHLARKLLERYLAKHRKTVPAEIWTDVYRENGFHEKNWKKVESDMQKIIALSTGNGVKTVIINIPQRPPWGKEKEYPGSRLKNMCLKAGCQVVDILPSFKKIKKPISLYWENDGHCKARGYQEIATIVSDYLQAHSLVP